MESALLLLLIGGCIATLVVIANIARAIIKARRDRRLGFDDDQFTGTGA